MRVLRNQPSYNPCEANKTWLFCILCKLSVRSFMLIGRISVNSLPSVLLLKEID